MEVGDFVGSEEQLLPNKQAHAVDAGGSDGLFSYRRNGIPAHVLLLGAFRDIAGQSIACKHSWCRLLDDGN